MTYNKISITPQEDEVVKNFPAKMVLLMLTAMITIAINVVIFSGNVENNDTPVVDTEKQKIEFINHKNV